MKKGTLEILAEIILPEIFPFGHIGSILGNI